MPTTILKYHEPDRRWAGIGIKTHEDFNNRFIVLGIFHQNVPSEIVEDYKIVERLICYSYYYYPLIDEAFSRVTRLFEAAINRRMSDLNLPVIEKYESLNDKIKRLEPYTSSEVIKEWDKARLIRNYFAHPTPGNLMGIAVHRSFLQMVNIINTIFLERDILENCESDLNILKKQSEGFNEGLFVYKHENKKILIWSIIPYSCFKVNDKSISLWVFHPVFTKFPQTEEMLNFPLPIFLRLTEVGFEKDKFRAKNLTTGKSIQAVRTSKPVNIKLLLDHKEHIFRAEYKVKEIYLHYLESEITYEVVKFLYYECWRLSRRR